MSDHSDKYRVKYINYCIGVDKYSISVKYFASVSKSMLVFHIDDKRVCVNALVSCLFDKIFACSINYLTLTTMSHFLRLLLTVLPFSLG